MKDIGVRKVKKEWQLFQEGRMMLFSDVWL